MLQFFNEKVFTAYNLGVLIGVLIAFIVVRFIILGVRFIIFAIGEYILALGLGKTRFKEPFETFLRTLDNFLKRFKWSDPGKDLSRRMDRTIDAMYRETWTPELDRQIKRESRRTELWDGIRVQIIWSIVIATILWYSKPWG